MLTGSFLHVVSSFRNFRFSRVQNLAYELVDCFFSEVLHALLYYVLSVFHNVISCCFQGSSATQQSKCINSIEQAPLSLPSSQGFKRSCLYWAVRGSKKVLDRLHRV